MTNELPEKYSSLAICSDRQIALDLLARPLQPKFIAIPSKIPKEDTTENTEYIPDQIILDTRPQKDRFKWFTTTCEEDIQKKRGADPIPPLKTTSKKIADASDQLEKGQAAAIFQLRLGYCQLRKHLYRINAEPDPKYEHCKVVELPTQFISYCRKYKKERHDFRMKVKKEEIKTKE
ncbi:hypothetical protein CROQUDRAFT_95277 [Cronartium quercuum f. sp. fusiforme G11]|uniref:Uncharacterized protein n=1 Tax=Cronartium quercuum f. sp. fusiforme G11 TaxID=708437 RepID=A0A9P6NE40_9BASI|nr:hypothetical protein CROQUDRAFT_95277 [Cronartium quercuum f. sp. fusiforme G11]